MRTPLTEVGAALCDIPQTDRLAEVEFLYPEKNDARIEERFTPLVLKCKERGVAMLSFPGYALT